jgi:serine phosphatase RsbU (regulator of sigma subunit)
VSLSPHAVTHESMRMRVLDGGLEHWGGQRLEKVARLAEALFGVPSALVILSQDTRGGSAALDIRPHALAMQDAAQRHHGLAIIEDATRDASFGSSPYVVGSPHVRFYAGHPLHSSDGARIGTFALIDHEPRAFTREQRQLLEDLAHWIEMEINLASELRGASEVQRRLLPQKHPDIAGYDVGGLCVPAQAVGGDFFDWHHCPGDHSWGLTIADVMGKGLAAAMLMVSVRSVMRGAATQPSALDAVKQAARTLTPDLEDTSSFVTLTHCRLHPELGLVHSVDAGHGLAMLVHADGSMDRLDATGPPLGVFADAAWSQRIIPLGPGDTFLSFTDGVLELFGGTFAGFHDVAALMSASTDTAEFIEEIRRRAEAMPTVDDVTVIALRRTAP